MGAVLHALLRSAWSPGVLLLLADTLTVRPFVVFAVELLVPTILSVGRYLLCIACQNLKAFDIVTTILIFD